MLSRRKLLLAGAAASAVAVSPAKAWFPHGVGGGGGSSPPPSGPADLTMTMRPTDTQLVDLSSALASVSTTQRVTMAVSGNVSARVWPYAFDLYGADGSAVATSKAFAKASLLRTGFSLVTNGASVGSGVGTVTFSWPGGSYTIAVNVDDTAPSTWTYGQNTLAQFGGYPLDQYFGAATDWTITGQSTPGVFTIATTTTGTKHIAFAGTSGSLTRAVGTPAGPYNVTVNSPSLGVTQTITFTIVPNQWDCASDDNTQLIKTMVAGAGTTSALSFGDVVMINDMPAGIYGNPTRTNTLAYINLKTPQQRAGGPAAPQGPYAGDSWEPQATRHAGWITVRPRTPWSVRLNFISLIPPTGGASYVRWFLLDHSNNQTPSVGANFTQNNANKVSWQMWDTIRASALNAFSAAVNSSVTATCLFALDNYIGFPGPTYNYISGTAQANTGLALSADDSQIVGNLVEGIGNDALAYCCFNTTFGSGRSRLWWNMVRNKQYNNTGGHGDFAQQYAASSIAKVSSYSTIDQRFEEASELGNILVRGKGMLGDATWGTWNGKDVTDGQCSWHGDYVMFAGEYKPVCKCAGQINLSGEAGGYGRKWAGAGSVIRNGTCLYPNYVTVPADLTQPLIRFFGASASITVSDTVHGGTQLAAGADPVNANAPIGSNNYVMPSTDATALFANPTAGMNSAHLTVEDVVDALTPKAGSLVTVAGGAARVIGAVGTGLIDHINRTYDGATGSPTVFEPDPSAPTQQAYWTSNGNISGTGTQAIGDTITIPSPTWTDPASGGSVLHRQWMRINIAGDPTTYTTLQTWTPGSAGDGLEYTIQSGDNGGRQIWYVERFTDSAGTICAYVGVAVTGNPVLVP